MKLIRKVLFYGRWLWQKLFQLFGQIRPYLIAIYGVVEFIHMVRDIISGMP